MAFRRAKRRTGTELFGFFAANDADLSSYLNGLPASERAALISTLDAALGIPARELFEERLAQFWFQYQEAEADSEGEARLAAIGRMLGYEYERVFKGSMAELTERFASVYVSSGLANTGDDQDEREDDDDVFTEAATILVGLCLTNDDVHEQDKALGPSCLYAGASVAGLLAGAGEAGGASTEDYVATILAEEDRESAGRVVYALAWYFALTLLGEGAKSIPRDGWLSAMQEALGPVDSLQIAEWEQLVQLFESYTAWSKNSATFPIMFCRWLNLHLGDEWSDTPEITSAMTVMSGCQQVREPFRESLVKAGLLSR